MYGIFGFISNKPVNVKHVRSVATFMQDRGRDASGLSYFTSGKYNVIRTDQLLRRTVQKIPHNVTFISAHSRLITNGVSDNQPILRGKMSVTHNGIVINYREIWTDLGEHPQTEVDSEILLGIAEFVLQRTNNVELIGSEILERVTGTVSAALLLSELGKLILISNCGSLFVGQSNGGFVYASERSALEAISTKNIKQLNSEYMVLDVPKGQITLKSDVKASKNNSLLHTITYNSNEHSILKYERPELKRCTKCILPETMPFIEFDAEGVCNYCNNYTPRNRPRKFEELSELVAPYRRINEADCIVPFSGGRDSCYSLHLIKNVLKMKPIAYTYDWGMVTDLGRRNISRMCSKLGVENIIYAADIKKKRRNINKNINAWLKSPDLGMVNLFTAGDKHFFRYVEDVKKKTGINLNIWGINPLEITHFKAGFLGVKPDFAEDKVYYSSVQKQLNYQKLRLLAMTKSLGYFNSSIFDTVRGEYYRSFTKKSDYYHLFDYWRWDEEEIDECLVTDYDWELASDTSTTWRIGDGTAAFYNYIYYTVAGFSEHDTFRSNQIREGDITREEALNRVADENLPRYENIKWYLESVNLDFYHVINQVNLIPKIYKN